MTRQLAVMHARADGAPRIVAQHDSMFIVTPDGEIWQIYDADERDWLGGGQPRNAPEVLARIFVGVEDDHPIRIYRFGADESRSITAWHMFAQLERAKRGDDHAI